MAEMLLTIQHNGQVFSPPVEEGVQIEWERTGSPGKLKFTTLKVDGQNMSFYEGDPVCFYYDNKPMFMGYVFTKKRDRENRIEVTCYDQIRYLKNKYTYVFENKTATQIIEALCTDFNLNTGSMEGTDYIIPAIAEENTAALDIAMSVLEESLLNTGNMYVLYDNFGKLEVKNCANMVSSTLIMEDTAENFDYSSSIDDETYNNVVLYYKDDDNKITLYTASSGDKISQWGTLRYFEETKNKTSAQNKANSLLNLYCRKTRKLKITGAFGDPTVRGGTLIPVKLNLGDVKTNNYMLVDKVVHNFDDGHHTMDLTLQGHWNDNVGTITSYNNDTATSNGGSGSSGGSSASGASAQFKKNWLINVSTVGNKSIGGNIEIIYKLNGESRRAQGDASGSLSVSVDADSKVTVNFKPKNGGHVDVDSMIGNWSGSGNIYTMTATTNGRLYIIWPRGSTFGSGNVGGYGGSS